MTKNFVSILILVYLVVGLVSLLKLLNHNFQTLSRNKALQHKILSTQLQLKDQELNYLKMQIHPHFLFNTLNTLYGLALKKSAHTPDVILKLSNLLDYILYQVSKPRVALHDEVEHIKAYIELERIRFQENLKVDFVAPAIPADLSVAPMLLIPFVENAFKHGNLMDGFLTIEIRITLAADRFDFYIRNTSFHEGAHPEREGIGLENMQKRLLLHYPHAHQLHVSRNGQWFEVSLTLFQLNAPTYESSGTMFDS
jgi:LytS/YehU family sensor histidine kinase